MNWKGMGILLSITLAALPSSTHAQNPQSVLEPETSNETRLNGLQPPAQVMDAIGVKTGMVVGEIGAGRGRYAVQLAVRVGAHGKIYAEDIDEDALRHCEDRCRRWELENVETIVGDLTDPKLPTGKLDLIFIISAYGHFSDPITLLRNARSALKPNGALAIVEWLPRDGRDTGKGSPKQIEAQLKAAGYRLERTDPLLKNNRLMIYIFRPEG
jgi:ubiquinone/menaquinone biosynthesis C-methylase UbiE